MEKKQLDKLIESLMIGDPSKVSVTVADAVKLLSSVQPIFANEPIVLDVAGPINICGDVHGQLNDLVHCLQIGGLPPYGRWLFLGDYVDRGPQSVEVICLLFALKVRYPKHVYLIRGNHETPEMSMTFGFFDECRQKLTTDLYAAFCEVFEYMPLAATVVKSYFCIHGGISPELDSISQIKQIDRPLKVPLEGMITDLLWSDPSPMTEQWATNYERGSTYTWGLAPLSNFLKKNKLKCLVRGHQVAIEGFEFPFFPNKSCITMFTASNYSEGVPNKAAFLVIDQVGKYEIKVLSNANALNFAPSPLASAAPKLRGRQRPSTALASHRKTLPPSEKKVNEQHNSVQNKNNNKFAQTTKPSVPIFFAENTRPTTQLRKKAGKPTLHRHSYSKKNSC